MEKIKSKILFTFIIFVGLFSLVLSKAFYLQVINKEKLQHYSRSQLIRYRKIYPNRGTIYDRNGSPLAINVERYSLFTIPKNDKNDFKSYLKLSKIVPSLSYESILKKVKNRKRYTWLQRKMELTKEQVKEIQKLKSIYIEREALRFYPNNELLAQTLGFVGIDNSGLSGVEYQFNKELKGEEKIIQYIKDAKGRPIRFETTQNENTTEDIQLTIDKELQAVLESALKDAVIKHDAVKGGGGVIDAETGEIWAIANYPTFDPNAIKKSSANSRKLSFVSDPFEPGSIFKALTIISAVENRVVRSDTNYYCEQGSLKVGGHIINESDQNKRYEWLSVSEILERSSNVGTTKIAFDLTYPKLKGTLDRFMIGQKTGVQIPGESRGIFLDRSNVDPLTLSNISFGQGVATTGLQMLRAYSVIANGGYLINPTIIKTNNELKKERIVEPEVVESLTAMLIRAVEQGTGHNAKVAHFKIAGKTSTAQKAKQGEGYRAYIPGFIGFPVGLPKKFVIYIYIDEPRNKHYYGNLVAAPVFKKLAQYILYQDKELNIYAKQLPKDKIPTLDMIKTGLSSARKIEVGKVPNFIGLDKKSAVRLAKELKLKLKHFGIGLVTKQSPQVGSQINKQGLIKLNYEPPEYD